MKHHQDLSGEEFQLFIQGDQRVFRKVFDRYHTLINRYVQSLTVQQQEIDDIVQQCFIQLYNHRASIQGPPGIYPYLFVIAKRLVIMAFRKRVLETRFQNESARDVEESYSETENQIGFNELQELLNQNIDLLPPRQREIYRLNKMEGYSYGEISSLMGCSVNTVKNQLVVASRKVRMQISKHFSSFFIFFFLLY